MQGRSTRTSYRRVRVPIYFLKSFAERFSNCELSFNYHWTEQRRGLRAGVPSINLCVKKWNPRAPQRRGSSYSGEGQNGGFRLIKAEWRVYKKIPLVSF